MLKSGVCVPAAELSRLSFFAQNFVANSGYLSSKG